MYSVNKIKKNRENPIGFTVRFPKWQRKRFFFKNTRVNYSIFDEQEIWNTIVQRCELAKSPVIFRVPCISQSSVLKIHPFLLSCGFHCTAETKSSNGNHCVRLFSLELGQCRIKICTMLSNNKAEANMPTFAHVIRFVRQRIQCCRRITCLITVFLLARVTDSTTGSFGIFVFVKT